MTLLEEIRDGFASMQSQGALKIANLPKEAPGYIIRISDGYGVAIPVDRDRVIAEKFRSCRFRTGLISINGAASNYLMLISAFEEYRYEFASLCAELVYPGPNGNERSVLLNDPLNWWKRWVELVGNDMYSKTAYCVIAELLVLEHKLKTDPSAKWTATRRGSRDIECDTEICEVKSTCKRYDAIVDIAGQYQLTHSEPLYLYFIRMEESVEGISINDMKQRLIHAGYHPGQLEIELQQQDFEQGASIRDRKYRVLEKRKYVIDESFPHITKESFKGDRVPDGITHIAYKVDLDAVPYTFW